MKKVFQNSDQLQCTFTDEGMFFDGTKQEIFFPYGCIDTLKLGLMGVLQVASRSTICSFVVGRKDRAEMKEAVKFAREAMKTAPEASVRVIDLTQKADDRVNAELPAAEQLRQYKNLFVQGAISKEEYDARKRQLQGK